MSTNFDNASPRLKDASDCSKMFEAERVLFIPGTNNTSITSDIKHTFDTGRTTIDSMFVKIRTSGEYNKLVDTARTSKQSQIKNDL